MDSEQQLPGAVQPEDQTDLPGDSGGHTRSHCTPIGVERTDYFLDVTSTVPHYYGLPAQLDVHRVSPVYRHGHGHCPVQAAVFVHGFSVNAVTAFDLQYQDYSVQERMAWAGIDTFSFNRIGYGLSTHFGLDDPCNASQADQKRLLIPNPLKTTCPNPDPFHFTNTLAALDEIDEVVNHVRESVDTRSVSLFAWSLGGAYAGPYAQLHPEKVRNMVLVAAGYDPIVPIDPPDPLPQPGPSLMVFDRADIEGIWNRQVDNKACPGEQDPAILDPIWDSMMARDPVGSSWGNGGILRRPSQDYWGFYSAIASQVTVPTLVVTGMRDLTVPPETMVRLYDDLGSRRKVLIKFDCGSHYLAWEASTSPTWVGGPHATFQDAVVQWLTSETYQGARRGTFEVHPDGGIEGPF
jgi:pimeloyl-ACP methyl ester carboxylesterase